jgi:hypothetical protein
MAPLPKTALADMLVTAIAFGFVLDVVKVSVFARLKIA